VPDAGRVGRPGQLDRAAQRRRDRLLGVDVLAGVDRLADRLLPLAGHERVEVDGGVGPGQRGRQVGGPLGQPVPGRDVVQLALVAPDQDGLRPEPPTVAQGNAAGLADRQQRADQVLPVPHPAGHAVHDDPDRDP
jgi:hypothetical protein